MSTDSVVDAAAADPSERDWRWPGLVLVLAFAAGALATTAGPLRDVDVFWHVRLGNELLDGVSIYHVGDDWSYAPNPLPWVSSQWLVEILFSWLHGLWGWNGLIAYRMVTTAACFFTLIWAIFPRGQIVRTRVWAACITFLLAMFTLLIFSQERPQQISFLLLPLVGLWWLRAVRDGYVPRWWAMFLLAAVWANCHGLWVMLPAVFAFAIIGRLMDHGRKDPVLKPLVIAFLAAVLGGCVTPIGPLNLLTPLRFIGSTSQISEWEPTSMVAVTSIGLTLFGVLTFIAWARRRNVAAARPARSEVFYVILLFIFGTAAARNVTPAVMMLAPLVAYRLSLSWRGPKPRIAPIGLQQASKPLAWVFAAAGFAMSAYLVVLTVAIPVDSRPVGLVEQIAAKPLPQRVLNSYNVSGLVLYYARPKVSAAWVEVGIDGRADRYGEAYIEQYLNMQRGRPGWDETVKELQPTIALLSEEDALVPLLQGLGWTVDGKEAEFILLSPPKPIA